jgi:hexosaminidase
MQVINVLSSNESLQLGTDESYTLNITSPNITLTANTTYGALRGLETFAQLLVPTYAGSKSHS